MILVVKHINPRLSVVIAPLDTNYDDVNFSFMNFDEIILFDLIIKNKLTYGRCLSSKHSHMNILKFSTLLSSMIKAQTIIKNHKNLLHLP